MRLSDFEEKVMEKTKDFVRFRILSFRIWHGHVKSCLGKIEGKFVVIWDGDGKCWMHNLTLEEHSLDDDAFVERFDFADTSSWMRCRCYDIAAYRTGGNQ